MIIKLFTILAILYQIGGEEYICDYSNYLQMGEYYISKRVEQFGVIEVKYCATNLNREIVFLPSFTYPLNLTISKTSALKSQFYRHY